MSWVKLDDAFHAHPKVRRAGNIGAGVYVRALSFCGAYHTDGFITRVDAAGIGKTGELKRVTDAELWEEVRPGDSRTVTGRRDSGNRPLPDVTLVFDTYGFFIPDYLQHNQTKDEVVAAREKRRAAGARGGQATAQANAVADAQADAEATGTAQSQPDQTRPVTEKPGLSVKDIEAAVEQLAASVTNADKDTAATFARELRALDRIDAAYVLQVADECAAAGDKGAGYALNSLRGEQARRMIAGVTLRAIDGRSAAA